MEEFGRTLRTLHSFVMPGDGRPDDHGRWGDPVTGLRRYLAAVREDTRHLPTAGLTGAEVARVIELLDRPVVPLDDPPVLCHGDLSPEHVFVDAALRVVGLIDWGQWSAGPAASDLADVVMRHPPADRDAVLAGHAFPADPGTHDQLYWYVITRATGQIRWLVDSHQLDELSGPAAAIRKALTMITG
jgi:aminoglycoside phosphotransferase (APT) family kinase protein